MVKSEETFTFESSVPIVFSIREVKQKFLSKVPAPDSHPNYFGISPYWRNLTMQRRASPRIVFLTSLLRCYMAFVFPETLLNMNNVFLQQIYLAEAYAFLQALSKIAQ